MKSPPFRWKLAEPKLSLAFGDGKGLLKGRKEKKKAKSISLLPFPLSPATRKEQLDSQLDELDCRVQFSISSMRFLQILSAH